jgi:hypothetical protein
MGKGREGAQVTGYNLSQDDGDATFGLKLATNSAMAVQ